VLLRRLSVTKPATLVVTVACVCCRRGPWPGARGHTGTADLHNAQRTTPLDRTEKSSSWVVAGMTGRRPGLVSALAPCMSAIAGGARGRTPLFPGKIIPPTTRFARSAGPGGRARGNNATPAPAPRKASRAHAMPAPRRPPAAQCAARHSFPIPPGHPTRVALTRAAGPRAFYYVAWPHVRQREGWESPRRECQLPTPVTRGGGGGGGAPLAPSRPSTPVSITIPAGDSASRPA
jgi:hypothetical protein